MSKRPTPQLRTAAFTALALAATPLAVGTAIADTSPHRAELPATAATKLLPAPQHNGVAWAAKISRGVAFVGGEFTTVRPFGAAPGASETPAGNFVAFDVTSGAVLPELSLAFNGPVKAIEVTGDGSTVLVSGLFTRVGDQKRYRFAAFNATTGALLPNTPTFDYRVEAIATHGQTVYVGGKFSDVNGQPRQNLAAFTLDGTVLPWAPGADQAVNALTISSDGARVVAGGMFSRLAGRWADGWGAIDAATGAGLPWQINQIMYSSGTNGGIYDLDSDDSGVYAVAYSFGAGSHFEGTGKATWNGELSWAKGCYGDSYGVSVSGPVVYQVNHNHDCEPLDGIPQRQPWIYQRADAVTAEPSAFGRVNFGGGYNGYPAPEQLQWYPDLTAGDYTGQVQAAWAVDAAEGYVLLAGEFPRVNQTNQYGIALFADAAVAGGEAPAKPWELNPNLTLGAFGRVTATFTALYDRDSHNVTYELLRDGEVVDTTTIEGARWWDRPSVILTDESATNGDHTYQVRVKDPEENAIVSSALPFTVVGAVEPSAYVDMLEAHDAKHLWRLDEPGGQIAYDRIGSNHMSVTSAAATGQEGALTAENNSATTFDGTGSVPAAATTPEANPTSFALETWFKTTSGSGGVLMGFGSSRTGTSFNRDRLVYMTSDGKLTFGVYTGLSTKTIASDAGYNDGQWHHVVANFSSAGSTLYVDGVKAAEDSGMNRAQNFTGYWKLAGESLFAWPDRPRSDNFTGTLDEAAVYPRPLTPGQVTEHYSQGAQADADNNPPEALFTVNVTDRVVNVDASGSSDPDGPIAGYTWDFGDGNTAEGSNFSHTYAADGTYTIRLTVTDEQGATDTRTDQVNVAEGGVIVPDVNTVREATEEFNRTSATSWGVSDSGTVWTHTGPAADFTVDGSHGVTKLSPGRERASVMSDVGSDAVRLTTDLEIAENVTGTIYYNYVLRGASGNTYTARLKVFPSGLTQLALLRREGSAQTTLVTETLLGDYTAGEKINLVAEAVGTSPTELRAKAWRDGDTEPADWLISATDDTATLQRAGYVGVLGYLSSSAGAPTNARIDRFIVSDVSAP